MWTQAKLLDLVIQTTSLFAKDLSSTTRLAECVAHIIVLQSYIRLKFFLTLSFLDSLLHEFNLKYSVICIVHVINVILNKIDSLMNSLLCCYYTIGSYNCLLLILKCRIIWLSSLRCVRGDESDILLIRSGVSSPSQTASQYARVRYSVRSQSWSASWTLRYIDHSMHTRSLLV